MANTVLRIRGIDIYKEYLTPDRQAELVDDIRQVVRHAPFAHPVTPGGRRMSVKMTSAGRFGWVTDQSGYRYERRQANDDPWPEIPEAVLRIWADLVSASRGPDCCLVNYYTDTAKMGMHQDKDEADFGWPVLSISLGDAALFRIGNLTRGGKTESLWLESGDVMVMGGDARLTYHGIDRIRPGSSRVLPHGGRINLTLRVVE